LQNCPNFAVAADGHRIVGGRNCLSRFAKFHGMTNNQTRPRANKLLGLELLRFVAALAVMVWHYQHFAYVADRPVDLFKNQLPFYRLLQPFYLAGDYGVWIFWCISGFIFFWKYRDAIADRSIGGWKFFVFRLSRLYPLHVVTLVLVAIMQPVYFHLNGYFFVYQANDLQHLLLQIFMASNWGFQSGNSFNGPIWSISVEVLVYAVFFLSLRFVTRSALLNLVVIVGCLQAGGQFACCLSFFYIGGLAAMARRAISSSAFSGAVEGIAWFAAVTFAVLGWVFASSSFGLPDLAILGYTPILLFCISGDVGVSPGIQRWIEAAGNLTYSSYLLHFPFQLVIALGFAMYGAPVPFYNASFFVIFVTATLVASRLTYLYLEAPAQDLIRDHLLRPDLVAFATPALPRKVD
jgi:peptidoglycan/LPS O-acetylase OafA/YrhL